MTSRVWAYPTVPLSLSDCLFATMFRGYGVLMLALGMFCLMDWRLALGNLSLGVILAVSVVVYQLLKASYLYVISRSVWRLECADGAWKLSFQSKFGTVHVDLPIEAVVRADAEETGLVIVLKDASQMEALHGCAADDVAQAASLLNDAVRESEGDQAQER